MNLNQNLTQRKDLSKVSSKSFLRVCQAYQSEYMRRSTDYSLLAFTKSYTVGLRDQLPCCCCPYLEQSARTCHVHTLYVFSEVASGLSYSDVPSHDFYRNFCSACAVTVIIFAHQHALKSFFLLAYLTYQHLKHPVVLVLYTSITCLLCICREISDRRHNSVVDQYRNHLQSSISAASSNYEC